MKYKALLLFLLLSYITIQAQPKVYSIEPLPNDTVVYSGNLSEGTFLDDLSWAWSSANACFPETQKQKFTGKHLFFVGIIPKYSEMTVTVVPKDTEANFSVYAYEIGANNNDLVPNLPSCIRCEADHKWERNYKGVAPQDHRRTVKDLVAINTPYKVVIG
ncbi:MAG: hypothetical protein AB3N14_12475, partial [Flavobacteriaceae bacterium]